MKPWHAFTAHPASVGETYLEHLATASRFSLRMLLAGCACLLHGLLPFLFPRTASDCIAELYGKMGARRLPAEGERGGEPDRAANRMS